MDVQKSHDYLTRISSQVDSAEDGDNRGQSGATSPEQDSFGTYTERNNSNDFDSCDVELERGDDNGGKKELSLCTFTEQWSKL